MTQLQFTEAGEIPVDWEVVQLGEAFEFRNGVNADKGAYGQGVPFINVLEVITNSHLTERDIPGRITLPRSVLDPFRVLPGDVVFNRTSETQDEVGLAAVYLGVQETVFGGFVIRARQRGATFDPTYLGYALRAPLVRRQIIPMGQGGIRANVGQSDLGRVLLPRPDLAEQRAIADVLTDLDGLIATREQLASKKRQIANAVATDLLGGRRRASTFDANWRAVSFGQIALPRTRRVDPRASGLGDFCIELEHVQSGTGRLAGAASSRDRSSLKTAFEPGDVLFGKLRPYLRKYWLADRPGVCTTEIWALAAQPELVVPDFLYQLVKTDTFIAAANNTTGTRMPRADWHSLKELEVTIPAPDEQRAIASILHDMDEELAAIDAHIAKLRMIRSGVAVDLLSGLRRVA